jgi:hypothetical protein
MTLKKSSRKFSGFGKVDFYHEISFLVKIEELELGKRSSLVDCFVPQGEGKTTLAMVRKLGIN